MLNTSAPQRAVATNGETADRIPLSSAVRVATGVPVRRACSLALVLMLGVSAIAMSGCTAGSSQRTWAQTAEPLPPDPPKAVEPSTLANG